MLLLKGENLDGNHSVVDVYVVEVDTFFSHCDEDILECCWRPLRGEEEVEEVSASEQLSPAAGLFLEGDRTFFLNIIAVMSTCDLGLSSTFLVGLLLVRSLPGVLLVAAAGLLDEDDGADAEGDEVGEDLEVVRLRRATSRACRMSAEVILRVGGVEDAGLPKLKLRRRAAGVRVGDDKVEFSLFFGVCTLDRVLYTSVSS